MESARATIEAATTAESNRHAYHQALTLTTVAAAQTQAGKHPGGAGRISVRRPKSPSQCRIPLNGPTGSRPLCPAGVEAEQFIEAAQIAELLTAPYDRSLALAEVALAQVKAGKAGAARVTIEMANDFSTSVEEPFERVHARALIANVQTTFGNLTDRTTTDMVAEAAHSLDAAYDRVRLFALVSLAQTEAGHIDAARATIELADGPTTQIDDPIERAQALALVARAHASGRFDATRDTIARAVEAAVSLEDTDQQTTRLREMASAYTKAGHFAEAVETAMLIEAVRGQVRALVAVASEQTKAGAVAEAQKTIIRAAETAKSNDADAQVLATIAATQAKAGLAEAAQTTFRDALQDIESKFYRYWYPGHMLAEVAVAQTTTEQGGGRSNDYQAGYHSRAIKPGL